MTLATTSFGAYLCQPLTDTLLVGCGNSPGNEAGCQIFRSADGVNFIHEFTPAEQGSVVDSQYINNEVWVCGHDPDEDWSLGNIYKRAANGTWTKLRTLPLTIHTLGLWHDGTNIFVATGGHTGDNVTWKGRILKSTTGGTSWTSVDVNNYRMYDIIGFNNKYYATGYDFTGSDYTYDLHTSSDGVAWSKIAGVAPASKPRLVIFNNRLILADYQLNHLHSLDTNETVFTHNLPFAVVGQWNVLAVSSPYLYVLASNGVWRSSDLTTWEFYAQVVNPISLVIWPPTGLIVSDSGFNTVLWKIPQS